MADETPGQQIAEALYAAKAASGKSLNKSQLANVIDAKIKELKLYRPKRMVSGRNIMFDALCVACGINPSDVTSSQGSNIGTALGEISAVSPDLTAEDLQLRANKYRKLYPDIAITPSGLAAHWGECWAGERTKQSAATTEPDGWRDVFREMCRDAEWSDRSIESVINAGWSRMSIEHRTGIIRRIQLKTSNEARPTNSES